MSTGSFIQWLHISDLHIGSPDSKWLDKTLRSKLLTFISDEVKQLDFVSNAFSLFGPTSTSVRGAQYVASQNDKEVRKNMALISSVHADNVHSSSLQMFIRQTVLRALTAPSLPLPVYVLFLSVLQPFPSADNLYSLQAVPKFRQ